MAQARCAVCVTSFCGSGALYAGGDWSYYNNTVAKNLFFNIGRKNVTCTPTFCPLFTPFSHIPY